MQIPMPLRRLLAGGLLPLILGMPLPSAAATVSPQNALNAAMLNEWTNQAMRSDVSVRVGVKQTAYKKTDPAGSASLAMHFQTRVVPKSGSLTGDQEGRISIDSLSADEALSDGMPVNLDGPLSFQWKLVDHTAYFQVEQIPQSVLELAQSLTETDYSVLLGRWIKMDLDENGSALESDLLKPDNARVQAIKALAMKAPPLLVTRVETKTKDASGHDLWRMRLRVNPTFLTGMYNLAYKEIPKSPASERAAEIKSLNTSYASIKTFLARTGLVAVVDVTNRQLTRMELGGSYPSPVKDCTYNAKLQEICRTTGTRTITVAVGINILKDDGSAVIPPADALDQAGLEALLGAQQPIDDTSDTSTWDLNDEQNLVAPDAAPAAIDPAVDHVLGNANAKVTVITYSDFECPFCQRMEPDLKRLLTDFPLDVRLVYRQFPLSSIHPDAQAAAEASECAAVQGGNDAFWKMHDKLMANPALFNRDGYLAFASQIGLNGTTFATCIDTHATAARVQRDLDSGTAAGVNGTPTSYVNGTAVEGAVGYTMLQNAVVSAGGIH